MAGKKTALTAEEKLAQALVPQEEWPYELPKGWVWTRVECIAIKISDGSHNPPQNSFSGIPLLSAANVYNNKIHFDETNRWITNEQWVEENKRTNIEKNDVLLTIVGTLGRTAVVDSAARFALQRSVAVIKPKFDAGYLSYYLSSPFVQTFMLNNAKGTAQKGFYLNKVAKIKCPLPPLPEQQRIVDKIQSLFARLDEARDKLQQVLEGTEARRAAILHEAFSGEWGTGDSEEGRVQSEDGAQEADGTVSVPEEWKKITLGDAYDLKAGKNIKAKEIYEKKDVHHPYPCYGGNGIRGYVQSFNREGLHPIIGRQGALCGNVNMADGEFYATEHAVVVTDKIPSNAVWTYYYLTYLNLNQYATSTAQPGLAVSNLNKIWIILPPLEVQQKVAEKLVSLYKKEDAAQKACESALAQIDLLKKAILARAFRGELGTGDPNDPSALDLLEQSL